MTTISATVIADSISPQGHRLTTLRCRYPRWIHAEGRTHRQLSMGELEWEPVTPALMWDKSISRNAASSRAIPVKKMIEAIRADPAIPLYWGKNQKGMQAGEEINAPINLYFSTPDGFQGHTVSREDAWLAGMESMIELSEAFNIAGYHKQIINRLLEPWMHIETLVTATEWDNFFQLRIHPDAEPHIQLLATRIREAMRASTPVPLNPGEWHLPFIKTELGLAHLLRIVSVARCAHLSYETVGTGEPIEVEQAQRIYDTLISSKPIHASPAEHQATPDSPAEFPMTYLRGGHGVSSEWQHPEEHGNFVGWRQFRKMIEVES